MSMFEEEHFEWRLFYPLISNDEDITTNVKQTSIVPFTLHTKLNMLSIIEEKYLRQTSCIDIHYILENRDVCLKVHDIDNLNKIKVDIEIRNRHKEQSSSFIQYWSIYEIKYPCTDLPDRISSRLDQLTIEKIKNCLHAIARTDDFQSRTDLSFIKIQKQINTWHMDDSDRRIEESDIYLMINDDLVLKDNNNRDSFYIPKHWRTLSIQTSDYDKLVKILTTLQIDDDKDLLDYFSYLISQTCFHSFPEQNQQQLFALVSPEKVYINLLTMSYSAFIELIQHMHQNQTYTK